MPLLRCTNEECRHQWFERSSLAVGSDCPVCDEPTVVVGADDDDEPWVDGPQIPGRPASQEGPRLSYARERARGVLREAGCAKPPVQVRALARLAGYSIREDVDLGALKGRLVGSEIQLAADREAVKRFTVAHELGHHYLGSTHSDGSRAEDEANAFAGELLVPGPMLLAALNRTRSTRELAKLFQVSWTVIQIAAQTHGKRNVLADG